MTQDDKIIGKNKCRSITDSLYAKNKIKRKNKCEICCSDKKIEGHHIDYNSPNIVIFLCLSCHRRIHSIIKKHLGIFNIKTNKYENNRRVSYGKK